MKIMIITNKNNDNDNDNEDTINDDNSVCYY